MTDAPTSNETPGLVAASDPTPNERWDRLVAFIAARLGEDAWWAREASRRDSEYVETGAHWQWETSHGDVPLTPDPTLHEFVKGDHETHNVSLRSVEEFPTTSVGPLPQFAIGYAEEVASTVAGHIVRHDPARVLREVEYGRWLLADTPSVVASSRWRGCGGTGSAGLSIPTTNLSGGRRDRAYPGHRHTAARRPPSHRSRRRS